MTRPAVILGSARGGGETRRAVDLAFPGGDAEIVVLSEQSVGPYDYEYRYAGDDFLSVVDVMERADHIVFATPVYWYSMSAQLKAFFDRLTDLTETSKERGRRLAGKHTWLLATGTDAELPNGFEVPFLRTSEYFAMTFHCAEYLCTHVDSGARLANERRVRDFGARVLKEANR